MSWRAIQRDVFVLSTNLVIIAGLVVIFGMLVGMKGLLAVGGLIIAARALRRRFERKTYAR